MNHLPYTPDEVRGEPPRFRGDAPLLIGLLAAPFLLIGATIKNVADDISFGRRTRKLRSKLPVLLLLLMPIMSSCESAFRWSLEYQGVKFGGELYKPAQGKQPVKVDPQK